MKIAVEVATGCVLQAHDSFYHGAYYLAVSTKFEKITVKRNLDPLDGRPAELDHPDFPVLVYVSNTSRTLELQRAFENGMPAITLLRSR